MMTEQAVKTVLVIDDEVESLRLYQETISDMGCRVLTGTDAGAALQLARDTGIDLVVTDYMMPGMNGLEFVTAFREIAPRTPIIMMTAHANLDNYLRAQREGVYEYINKPFRLEELKRVIEIALQRPVTNAVEDVAADAPAHHADRKRHAESVEWTDDLAVDVPKIDRQHRELFTQIDELLKAWAGGRGLAEVEAMIKFLESYVEDHFGTEEHYMTKYAYTGRSQHIAQHGVFKNAFERIKDRFYRQGADDNLIAETNDLLVDWFRNHIRYVDQAFGLFLKSKLHEAGLKGRERKGGM